MTAFAMVLTFWTDKIPVAAVVAFLIVLYASLNIFAVSYYGEAEFWLACGKVFLIIGLAWKRSTKTSKADLLQV